MLTTHTDSGDDAHLRIRPHALAEIKNHAVLIAGHHDVVGVQNRRRIEVDRDLLAERYRFLRILHRPHYSAWD